MDDENQREQSLQLENNSARTREKHRWLCLIMGLVGVLWAVVLALFFPQSQLPPDMRGFPRAIALGETILWKAIHWPWTLLTCTLLTAEFWRIRYEKKAWAAAFSVGLLMGYIVIGAVRRAARWP